MNLILFERAETALPLPRSDRRALHLLEVLKRRPGDSFDAGMVNGPRGKGTITGVSQEGLLLSFSWNEEATTAGSPLILLIGLPRPQTARSILRDVTSLGVAAMHFVTTEKGDSNYGLSSLWHTGEWRRHLIAGVEQAFCTRLPEVTYGQTLAAAISGLPKGERVALDNYESARPFSHLIEVRTPVVLAVGPERGWSASERDLLRQQSFTLADLGRRVLRTETACIAAVALVNARQGWL